MTTILEYTCPCCGGRIEFDSAEQKPKCPYCDTVFELEALRAYDEVLNAPQTDDMNWETPAGGKWQADEADGLGVFTCRSCGGEIVAERTTAATSCPFCDSPVVLTHALAGDLKPDYVIPFKLDKQAAKAGFLQHLKGKRLLPKMFRDENHIDEIKGVYVPFWLFDADAEAEQYYKATRVRCWSDRNYTYTETSFFSAVRAGALGFERVPADGSRKIPNELTESVEPYDFSQAVPFQSAYLAGYTADRYDVTAEQSADRVNERIRRSTEDALAATVTGFHTVTRENGSVHLKNSRALYALYPLWLLHTTWNGQKYTFAMNGQTGKFVGDLPLDKRAYWRWFGGIAAAASAVLFTLISLLWLM